MYMYKIQRCLVMYNHIIPYTCSRMESLIPHRGCCYGGHCCPQLITLQTHAAAISERDQKHNHDHELRVLNMSTLIRKCKICKATASVLSKTWLFRSGKQGINQEISLKYEWLFVCENRIIWSNLFCYIVHVQLTMKLKKPIHDFQEQMT